MRTTLAIDDDVLLVARDLARQQRRSLGEVVSDLARQSLRPASDTSSRSTRNGFVLLPVSNPAAIVTMELVDALRDELE